MENPELKRNPFDLPANYFPNLMESISKRISAESGQKAETDEGERGIGIGLKWYIWPRIGYAAVISLSLIIGYIAIVPSTVDKAVPEIASTEISIIESGFLYTSFIDFFDAEVDTSYAVIDEENIPDEEIISFLSENAGIMLLASLD